MLQNLPSRRVITALRKVGKERKALRYTVILHAAEEGGYWVEVPALSGCFSQGKTKEEALSNIEEAIKQHIEVLKKRGEPVPFEDEEIEAIKVAI